MNRSVKDSLSTATRSFQLTVILLVWAMLTLLFSTNVLAQTIEQPRDLSPIRVTDAISGNDIVVDEASFGQMKLTVVCFLGTECPMAKLYAGRLAELNDQFPNVRLVGLFSNVQDSLEDIKQFSETNSIGFEIAKDINNVIADQNGVKRTPEVIVVDPQMKIRYRGRVDDQYSPGVARSKATNRELETAIVELLSGKEVTTPVTEATGCLLGRAKTGDENVDAEVTFAKQISRVLQRNCVECHREGEIGPFALTDYDEVVGWADMMLEVIDNGRMPPWHATQEHAKFSNARLMSDEDKQLLKQWVDLGMPKGDEADLPPAYLASTGWRLPGEPDQIIAMSETPYRIPADGTVEYQYFVVDPGFKEDLWVTAAEIIPGNRAVVHHSIAFVRPPDGEYLNGVGWLSAYVPGQLPLKQQPNRARRIPAGSKIVFQQHYTPNGVEHTDVTKLGLVFADDSEIEHELVTLVALDQTFEIKPGDASHTVSASVDYLPPSASLLAISPHMHYRGKAFRSYVSSNQGKDNTLLHVPHYDFNWQHRYELAEPLNFSDIDELSIDAEFDNSENNPFNPDPSQYVTWGDQTWEEMAVAFFDVSIPRNPTADSASANSNATATDETTTESEDANEMGELIAKKSEQQDKADSFVKTFFKRFDKNEDGEVKYDEMPMATRSWSFHRLDSNDDGKLTRDEIKVHAAARMKAP